MITLNQTQSKKFHCTYLLHYYPFDTQVCTVDYQLEQFAQETVELVPMNIEMLSPTELTQYYIKTWSLIFNNPSSILDSAHFIHFLLFFLKEMHSDGLKMEIVFKRRLTNELLTTYLPSFLLLIISYATTWFKPFYFEASVTVNLSVMLVTTTLFIRHIFSKYI